MYPRFCSTLARDIIVHEPTTTHCIKKALEDDPQLFQRSTEDHIEILDHDLIILSSLHQPIYLC